MPTIRINTSTDGESLVAAPGAGKAIQIHSWDLTAAGAVIPAFETGATTLWDTQAMNIAGGGTGIVIPYSPARTLIGTTNTALTIGLSAAVNVRGTLDYSIVDVIS